MPNELLHDVEETARAQNRKREEIVSEALRKYLDEQTWVEFVEKNERTARANGITQEDVERLIAENRATALPCLGPDCN